MNVKKQEKFADVLYRWSQTEFRAPKQKVLLSGPQNPIPDQQLARNFLQAGCN